LLEFLEILKALGNVNHIKNYLKEENPITSKKNDENSNKKEKKYSEKIGKNNDVKKLTQNEEESKTINIGDSTVNQTKNRKKCIIN
jgi:hypothetical protein